jgi:small subunit ribosomal protein S6
MAEQTTPAAPAAAPAAPVQPIPELPEGTRLYESMWVIEASQGREDYARISALIKEVIEKGGGSVLNLEKWEERRLMYPIKKKKRGLYIICHFTAPTQSIVKIERQARLTDDILRHMILIDEDGLSTVPVIRPVDDDDFGGGHDRR